MNNVVFKACSVFWTLSLFFFSFSLAAQSNTCRRQLKVSLYPYIPNPDNFYQKVETDFEKKYPDIDLIITQNANYYDEATGIINDQADVYEVDCILLKDFIDRSKIQKLNPWPYMNSPVTDESYLLPAGRKILMETGYAFPHWICGNFLLYKAGDTPLGNIKKLSDLENVIGKNPSMKNGLLIDMKGKLTIGELYADALMDKYNNLDSVRKYAYLPNLNIPTVNNLNRVVDLTYSNWGRVDSYHDKTGFYAKQFAKNNGRALVGYSESLYYAIHETENACHNEEGCITPIFDVAEVPFSDNGSHPLGWVDAFVIDAKADGIKVFDAGCFIFFMCTDDAMLHALIPDWGDAPRYLLPAQRQYYTRPEILKRAPLYAKFLPLVEKIQTVQGSGISPSLREIGKKLDKEYLKN